MASEVPEEELDDFPHMDFSDDEPNIEIEGIVGLGEDAPINVETKAGVGLGGDAPVNVETEAKVGLGRKASNNEEEVDAWNRWAETNPFRDLAKECDNIFTTKETKEHHTTLPMHNPRVNPNGTTFSMRKSSNFIRTCPDRSDQSNKNVNAQWVAMEVKETIRTMRTTRPICEGANFKKVCLAKCSKDLQSNQWKSSSVMFKESFDGWLNGCRPVLGLDGYFLNECKKLGPTSLRFCFRHMYKNIKKFHRGTQIEWLVWSIAKAFKQSEKNKHMDQLKLENPAAYDWLLKEPFEYWARSDFDFTAKCEYITSNFRGSRQKSGKKQGAPATPRPRVAKAPKRVDANVSMTRHMCSVGLPPTISNMRGRESGGIGGGGGRSSRGARQTQDTKAPRPTQASQAPRQTRASTQQVQSPKQTQSRQTQATDAPRQTRATPRNTRASQAQSQSQATGAPRKTRSSQAQWQSQATASPRLTRASQAQSQSQATGALRKARASQSQSQSQATRAPRQNQASQAQRQSQAT
ncbi:hypothetical protein GIB67_028418 [Kingdonia uniflora]|uniref:Uncharacterized protein n=1 Tax=Kingdonia uniflora TaxID=39325 RepID=A0A7J7MI07_9MAGN|nr:hypothetical protein GIB67_028418 [Kingdonia uniflora]